MTRRTPLILFGIVAFSVLALHEDSRAPVLPAASASFGHGSEIVLVHGLGSTAEHWLPTARILSRDHHVTLTDLPGHGETAMPEQFSLEQAAASLDAALAARGTEPVVLVGHSLGGLVCAEEAIRHPERVRALVLVETSLKSKLPDAQRTQLLGQLDTNYEALVHGAYVSFGRDSAQGEALWREVAGLDHEMMKRWIRLAWTTDLSKDAARLNVPTLMVLAPRSWEAGETWPQVASELGVERVPHIRAERFFGCGHFIMLDRPADLARLIATFAANPGNDELRAAR